MKQLNTMLIYTKPITIQKLILFFKVQHISKPKSNWTCFFCGGNKFHNRNQCPAYNTTCKNCHRKNHFASVCHSKQNVSAAIDDDYSSDLNYLATSNDAINNNSIAKVEVNKQFFDALLDTGSSKNYIDNKLVDELGLETTECNMLITLASSINKINITKKCIINITVNDKQYEQVQLFILSNLCHPLILGIEFLSLHKSVTFTFEGNKEKIEICSLNSMNIEPPRLFKHLHTYVKPIACPFRKYNEIDKQILDT